MRARERQIVNGPRPAPPGSPRGPACLDVLPPPPPRLVALGDSITVGEDAQANELPCRSWARWLADALNLEAQVLARNGVGAREVLREQLPRVTGPHALATLYIGVNDVRSPAWQRDAFARDLPVIVTELAARCDALLLCTIPLDLGRPRAGAGKVNEANATIRHEAAAHGAVLCELDDLAGSELLTEDAVHPTALGQREIARRAQRALAQAGILGA